MNKLSCILYSTLVTTIVTFSIGYADNMSVAEKQILSIKNPKPSQEMLAADINNNASIGSPLNDVCLSCASF